MFETHTQIGQLIKRLDTLQHRFFHGLETEIDQQQRHVDQARRRLVKQARQQTHRLSEQTHRISDRLSDRFTNLSHVGQRQQTAPVTGAGIGLAVGLLAVGGLGYLAYRTLQTQKQSRSSLKSAPGVDLNRFAGKWFEIARFPGKHQDIAGMTLTYTVNADNSLDVVCTYHDHDLNGPEHTERKHIVVAEPDNRSHLKKQIFGPLGTDYWILELGKNYEYAVLGTPSRKHLWVLSRTPKIEEGRYEEILGRMEEQGFDISNLVKVKQDEHAPVALTSHLQGLLEQKQQYFKKEQNKHLGPNPEKRDKM